MRKVIASAFLFLFFLLAIPYFVGTAYAEPSLPEVLNTLGFSNVAKVHATDVTFPPGVYEITLFAEFAGYNERNELAYYEVGETTYNMIFAGSEGNFGYLSPPITKTFTIDYWFGLSMYVGHEDHRYFTENSLNPDGQIHSVVYENLAEPAMYIIGFENLYGTGDRDYQDMVFSIQLQTPQQMIPEVPFGTIMIMATMVLAIIGFVGLKRFPAHGSRYRRNEQANFLN